MTTTKALTVTLQIPLTFRMKALQADQEQAYIDACMSYPGNCDNDLTERENQTWFRDMWQQQIRFQQALLNNPQQLASFLRYIALEKITSPSFFSTDKPFLSAPEIEDVAAPIAESIDASEHFFQAASSGVDTGTMLSDLIEAIEVQLSGEPALSDLIEAIEVQLAKVPALA